MFIFTIWVPSWLGPHPPHWVKNLWCRASISSPLEACLEVRFLLKNPKVCVGGCPKQHDPGALWPPPRPPRWGGHFSKNRPIYKRKRCTLQFKILKPGTKLVRLDVTHHFLKSAQLFSVSCLFPPMPPLPRRGSKFEKNHQKYGEKSGFS